MADNSIDGALGTSATIDSSGATKGSKEYVEAIDKMEKATDKAGKSLEETEKVIENVGHSVEDAAKSFSSLEEATKYAEKLQKQINDLDADIEKFSSVKDELTLKGDVEGAEKYSQKISETIEETIRLGNELQNTQLWIEEMGKSMQTQQEGFEKTISLTKEQEDEFQNIKEIVRDYSRTAAQLIGRMSGENKTIVSDEDIQKANAAVAAINALKREFDKLTAAKSSPEEFSAAMKKMKDAIEQITSDNSMNDFFAEVLRNEGEVGDAIDENEKKEEEKQEKLRKELRKTKEEIEQLCYSLAQMSETELGSEEAQEMQKRLSELTQKAGEMTSAINSSKQAIKEMASSTRAFDAISEGVDTVISGIGGIIGVAGLFEDEQEELIELQTKLQSVLTVSNALKTVQTNLQKQSALMMGIEAAQTRAAAIAVSIKTAAEGKGIVVTKLATLAQAAFNFVAKQNPYLVLAAALISVIGVVSAYVFGMKKAKKAEEEHQKELKRTAEAHRKLVESQKEIATASAKAVSSFTKLQTEWKSLKTTAEKKQWIDQNKTAFEQLGITINKVGTAEKVFSSQTNAFAQAMAARAIAAAKAAQAVEEYMNFVANQPTTVKKYGNVKAGDSLSKLSDEEKTAMMRQGIAGYAGKLTQEGALFIQQLRHQKAIEASQKQHIENAKKEKELRDKIVKATEEEIKANKKLSNLGDPKKDKSQEAEDKKRAAEERKRKAEDKKRAAEERKRKAEEERRAAAEEKLRKILDKDARQRIRQEEDLELEAQQNMINLMAEGADKQLAQRELNHKKAMLQIQRESEDRKNALIEMARNEFQNDASNKGKNFDAEAYINSDTFKTQSEKIDKNTADKSKALQLNYDREEQQAKLQALYSYLEAYGTAEEKRFAITKKYEEEIAKAKDEYTKEALKNRMKEELKALDAQDAFNSINWDTVFTDLSSHTKEYLVYLRDELQKLISSNKLSNIADIEKVQQKINELNVKINDKSGLFEFKGERAMERERLQANVTNAQREFSNAIGDVGAASAHLESLKATNASIEAIDAAEKRLARTREKAKEAAEKLKNAEDSAERDSAQAVADWFADAQEFIAKKGIDQLPNLLDSLGMGGVGEKIGKGLSGFDNAAGAAADFASGNYVGAALKAVSAIKDFGSALGIGGGNAAEVNKLTEQNTRAIERLNGRLESLTKALDNANGVQAVEISQQMVDIQKEINQLASETLQAQMGYNSAHHSNDYYANDAEVRRLYNADARRAEKLSGVDMPDNIKGIGDVEKMTPEQLNAIRTYMPKLWEYLTTVGKYDKSEYWDAVADQAGKVEDIVGKLNEKLTMTSFDSLRDSWLGTLSDMESSSEDFANSFSDMMYKAMVNSFVLDEEFDKWLKEWQEKYAKAVQNNDTNALEGLRNDALDMREKKIAERERLAATMGYDGGRTAQEATANGIKNITADQADQLVGRITAMQIAVEAMKADQAMNLADIKEFSSLMQSDVSSIKGYMEEQNGYISEIADIQYESNRYLNDIAKNTSHLELIAEDITRIKENTSRL